jgi:ABC-type glycerol-3-phosphate transport system permease component
MNVCVVTGTSTTLLRLVYGYSESTMPLVRRKVLTVACCAAMAFDLTVLLVSTIGLLRSGGTQGSGLWKLLFRDGIVYFMVAFAGNAVASVSVSISITLSVN